MSGNILSPPHLLLVLAVALIVLGPSGYRRRGLGSAIRDFTGSLSGADLTDELPAAASLSEPDRALVASPPDPSAAGVSFAVSR